MTLPLATERLIRVAAEQAWGQRPRIQRLLLLHAQPHWSGPDTLETPQGALAIRTGRSTLEVDDALSSTDDDQRVVILTGLTDPELGISLLSRAVGQRVRTVDRWDAVRSVFSVSNESGLDPLLVREGDAVAEALTSFTPPDGWPNPPMGILTRDFAMGSLTDRVLELPTPIDVSGLLQWSRDPEATIRLHELPDDLQGRLTTWITQQAGPGASPVLRLAARGEGHEALPLALAADALWSTLDAGREQGRFEQRYLAAHLSEVDRQAWATAANGWTERALYAEPTSADSVLEQAQTILDDLERSDLAQASPLMPAGFESRMAAAAKAIGSAVKSGDFAGAEAAVLAVTAHRYSPRQAERTRFISMALRLARWNAQPNFKPQSVDDALDWQSRTGAWVDRARQVVINGDPNPQVAKALAPLITATNERRRSIDRQGAALIAAASSSNQRFGAVLPVEEAAQRMLVPLSAEVPILVVVVDGMSTAVATELADDITAQGWSEVIQAERRGALLSALPSVTQVSRASLLSGALTTGGQDRERAGVKQAFGQGAVLLHESRLDGSTGGDVSQEVDELLSDTSNRTIITVLNAVDDSLASGDPARTAWSVSAVRHLGPLLRRAAASGRAVVLLSDHGHIVDRGEEGTLRRASGGSRWRESGEGPAQQDEVEISGARVLLGNGSVIAAVDETLRYRPRKEGYHGGLALAEVTIPTLVMVRTGSSIPPGWNLAPPQQPEWWDAQSSTEEAPADSLFGDTAAQQALSELERLLEQGVLSTATPLERDILRALAQQGSPCSLVVLAREGSIPVDEVRQSLTSVARRLSDVTDEPVVSLSPGGDRATLDLAPLTSQT